MLTGIKTTKNYNDLDLIQSAIPVDCVEVKLIHFDAKLQVPVIFKPFQALSM